MVQYLGNYKKGIAIDMRSKGASYSEIGSRLNIPKSTVACWVKNINLTPGQKKQLDELKIKTAKNNAVKKSTRLQKEFGEIREMASREIIKISKRNLWLMGIVLCWKKSEFKNFSKGVSFSSSDPDLINFFLKWIWDVGNISNDEIKFDIFIKTYIDFSKKDRKHKKGINYDLRKTSMEYWAKILGFNSTLKYNFTPNIYFQKSHSSKESAKSFLRVRISKSSLLARQIHGWIEGIKKVTKV